MYITIEYIGYSNTKGWIVLIYITLLKFKFVITFADLIFIPKIYTKSVTEVSSLRIIIN